MRLNLVVTLYEKYPNLCVIPMIHNVDIHKTENVLLVVINLLSDEIYLLKGETMGFMQIQSLDVSEIMTETSTRTLTLYSYLRMTIKWYSINKREERNKEGIEKRFITSPADTDVHREVELHDADITDEQRNGFKDLCTEFNDIFSTDSR